jgi:hypothetical protein
MVINRGWTAWSKNGGTTNSPRATEDCQITEPLGPHRRLEPNYSLDPDQRGWKFRLPHAMFMLKPSMAGLESSAPEDGSKDEEETVSEPCCAVRSTATCARHGHLFAPCVVELSCGQFASLVL